MANPIGAPGDAIIQFVTKAFETEDAFIFETIRPFCESQVKMVITKDELIKALTLLREQEPVKPVVYESDGWCWYRCGKCGNLLASGVGERAVRSFGASKYPVYCETCGKKVDWDG